jgi:hypothetical protein
MAVAASESSVMAGKLLVVTHDRHRARARTGERRRGRARVSTKTDAFRFDCVFYYVSDLDRAIAFYTNALGFRLSSRD